MGSFDNEFRKYLMFSQTSVVHSGEPSLPQTTNYPQPIILEHCAPATSSAAHTVHFKRKKERHKYISCCANELWELGIKTPGNTLDLRDNQVPQRYTCPTRGGKESKFWDPGSSPFSHSIVNSGVVAPNICIDNELKYLSLFLAHILIPHPICGLHSMSISILKHIRASEGHYFTFVPSDRWRALQSLLEMRNGDLAMKKFLPKYNQSRVIVRKIILQVFSSPRHSSTAWAVPLFRVLDQCLWTQSFQHLYFLENSGSRQKILSSGVKKNKVQWWCEFLHRTNQTAWSRHQTSLVLPWTPSFFNHIRDSVKVSTHMVSFYRSGLSSLYLGSPEKHRENFHKLQWFKIFLSPRLQTLLSLVSLFLNWQ